MLDKREYCKLVIYDVVEETARMCKSAFVQFKNNSVWQQIANPAGALAQLEQEGWQVTTTTSSIHLDGTIQKTFCLERSVADTNG